MTKLRPFYARLTALIIAAWLASLAVAAISFLGLWLAVIFQYGHGGRASAFFGGIPIGMLGAISGFAISFPLFLFGIGVVGIPTWWGLHVARRTSATALATVAALETVGAGGIVFRFLMPDLVIVAPLLAIPGGLAGWAIWRYGYYPVTPPPVRPV